MTSAIFGAMAERLKAAVLKTVVLKGTGGSNPSRSVAKMLKKVHKFPLGACIKLLERCERGRIGLPAKELYPYGYRGFESPLLRNTQFCVLFEAIAQLDRASDCGSEGRQFEPA